jgi:hypothetical protein
MAPVIAGIILTYRGKWIVGTAITAFSLALELSANHLQITYYLTLAIGLLVVSELIQAVLNKKLIEFVKASALLLVAALLAVGPNITNLLVTADYGKFTTRGKSELTDNKSNKTSGLDKDYATSWSYGKGESFSLMIPNFNGGASGSIGENKNALENVMPDYRQDVGRADAYFGDQPFTSGPVYAGSIICFLFVLGLLIVKSHLRWWLLAATVFSLVLAWGKNFMPLTDLFLDYFPAYNKFRAVSMILVIAEFCIPFLAVLALKEIIEKPGLISDNKKKIYLSFGLTGGLCLLFYLLPDAFVDFFKTGEYEDISNQLRKSQATQEQINIFMSGIESARKSIFTADALRSFFFILSAAALLFTFAIKKLNKNILLSYLLMTN